MDLFLEIIKWMIKLIILSLCGFAVLFPYDFWRVFKGKNVKKQPFFLYFIFIRIVALFIFVTALIFFFIG